MGAGPIAAYLALCVVWGSTFLAIRIAVETLPPWSMIGVRCLIAGAILAGIALARGASLPRGRAAWLSAASSGVLLFTCSQAMLSWSERAVPSGEAALLVCTVSLFTPVVSWLMGASARPRPLAVAGLLLGFAGVAMLVRPDGSHAQHMASLVILLSSLAWAIGASVARLVAPAGSALLGSGLQLLAGGIACLAFAGLRGEWSHLDTALISVRSVAAMGYLIVMGSLVAFACFGWLVQIWQPDVLSTYGFINPLVALLLGAALAGETIGAREMGAAAIILCAVALVMGAGQERPSFLKKRSKKLLGGLAPTYPAAPTE
jgi:drug/metabolite transporter (DMT)-like permease